ncbi:hypothetical protein [Streptomyces synnematoformans]|uniref:DUF8175 domain-containing protein n=1 Tax=Streptomyces synnematoformans TaxID=415721 RepID=A0ABP5J4S8_9ACTN
MTAPDPYQDEPSPSPWTRPWFIASVGFMGVVVLMLVVVLVAGDGNDDGGDQAAPSPAPSTSASRPDAGDGEGCPELEESDEVPDGPPPANWDLFRTVALPVSKEAGPAVIDGDVARCYAHSPTGALMAAVQIGTRYTLAEDWQTVMEEQTYGDAKDQLIEARSELEATAPPPAPAPGELGQIAAFDITTYSPDTAVVQLVTRFVDGSLQASTATLRWMDGDWRYEVSETSAPQKTVLSTTGFTEWGGV